MSAIVHLWNRLYSLDTLDPRFTHSATVPVQTAASEHGIDGTKPAVTDNESAAKLRSNPGTQPSRWNTAEYYFYYLVFLVIVPLMFYVPHTVSKGSHVCFLYISQGTLTKMNNRIRSTVSQV